MVKTDDIPQDLEAERALIGITLLNGHDAFDAIDKHAKAGGLFFDERHRELWNRAERIYQAQKPISFTSVRTEKVEFEIPDDYLFQLQDEALGSSFIGTYLPDALQAQKRRAAINTGLALVARATDDTEPIDQVIDAAEQALFTTRFKDEQTQSIKDSIREAVADWQHAEANPNVKTGVESGFADLDELTWGFQPKNLVIIGARPSQGKTALLCNIAAFAAVTNNVPTLFFSLEMTQKELVKRMICSMSGQDSAALRSGHSVNTKAVTTAGIQVSRAPLTIIDDGNLTINQMRSIARRYAKRYGIKLVLVDYLQKIKPGMRQEKRTYEVGEVSTGLKELAKELAVPVIAACQLNRESEKDKGRPPRPSDLGDSGMIERDADIIANLYRDPEVDPTQPTTPYKLFVQKHRDGGTGTVNLTFQKRCTRFEGYASAQTWDVPVPGVAARN